MIRFRSWVSTTSLLVMILLVCVIILSILMGGIEQDELIGSIEVLPDELSEVYQSELRNEAARVSTGRSVQDDVRGEDEAVSLARLISICGDMSITPSQICVTTLAELFSTQRVHIPLDFKVPERSVVTFQEIFDSPKQNYLESKNTLARSECWLEEGELNFDLADECNPRTMVRHALFSFYCGQFSGQNDGLESLAEEVNNTGENHFEHALSRYQRNEYTPRDEVMLEYYRGAFIKLQCHAAPDWTKSRLGYWRNKWEQIVRDHISLASHEDKTEFETSVRTRTGEFYRMLEFQHWELEFHGLMEKASRLGDEFALIGLHTMLDGESDNILRSLRPDIHYLQSIRYESSPARRLELSMIAREYAAKHGWDLDTDYLWKVICSNQVDSPACANLMDSIDVQLVIDAGAQGQITFFTNSLYDTVTRQ